MSDRLLTLIEARDVLDPESYRKYVAIIQQRGLPIDSVRIAVRWDESEHPREPAGSPTGGQFTSGGGGGGESGAEAGGGKTPVSDAKPSAPDKPQKKKVDSTREFSNQGVQLESDLRTNDAAGKKFLDRWNDVVGEAPADFKHKFLGGLAGSMRLAFSSSKDEMTISGAIHDDAGNSIGEYSRDIDLDDKQAYSAYFKMKSAERGGGIGKKLLAGNVQMYQQLGLEKLKVTANIDVGGYAWARFGYVPTPAAWGELSRTIRNRIDNLEGGGGRSSGGGDTYQPESWDMIGESDRDRIFNAWANDTRSEFIDFEIESWRESGQALEQAKRELAEKAEDLDKPEWMLAAIQEWRENRVESGEPDPPYTDAQIAKAITIEPYESRYGEGREDPDIDFDDAFLKEPAGYDPAQQTLPGIEPVAPEDYFTKDMRDSLRDDLVHEFNKKAESDAADIEPPDYISQDIGSYQEEHWDAMDDDQRYNWARDNNELPEYEYESDDEDEDAPAEDEGAPEPEEGALSALRKLTTSSDPKAVWAIADSPYGKQLLLNTAWSGVINFSDKEQMDRFHAYVSKG